MRLYTLDPLLDSRWNDLVAAHPQASVFHHPGWLRALARTYGYRTMVLTTTPPGEPLSDGLPFCEVKSWITGRRLVSLPFSDHAQPLLNESGRDFELSDWMREECEEANLRYIEIRPLILGSHSTENMSLSESFWSHTLDLSPPVEQLFRRSHKNCIQRRVRHAERQRLTYERGNSAQLLDAFYRLLVITRRRHQLLPQPLAWFRNLLDCMAPEAEIRMVRKDSTAIAAILTLRHGHTVVYKYGCSDGRFHHLAGMPLLLWRLIEESRNEGGEQIDLGRTELDNAGLIRFKDRLGALRTRMNYYRYTAGERKSSVMTSGSPATRALCSALPGVISSRAGGLIYRHIG